MCNLLLRHNIVYFMQLIFSRSIIKKVSVFVVTKIRTKLIYVIPYVIPILYSFYKNKKKIASKQHTMYQYRL